MWRMKQKLNNEKGSFTLEFLTVIPYYFFFFLLLWQAVASGFAVLNAQSAVNEAAKVYAVTGSVIEARDAAQDALGSGDIIEYRDFYPVSTGPRTFEAVLEVRHGLVFVPADWRHRASIAFTQKATGRLLR